MQWNPKRPYSESTAVFLLTLVSLCVFVLTFVFPRSNLELCGIRVRSNPVMSYQPIEPGRQRTPGLPYRVNSEAFLTFDLLFVSFVMIKFLFSTLVDVCRRVACMNGSPNCCEHVVRITTRSVFPDPMNLVFKSFRSVAAHRGLSARVMARQRSTPEFGEYSPPVLPSQPSRDTILTGNSIRTSLVSVVPRDPGQFP